MRDKEVIVCFTTPGDDDALERFKRFSGTSSYVDMGIDPVGLHRFRFNQADWDDYCRNRPR